MKDPLRYYIAEGFVTFFVFPDPTTKRLDYRPIATTAHLSNFNIEKNGGEWTLTVFGPGYEERTYRMNDDFLLDYGVMHKTKAEADAKVDEYTEFVTETARTFRKAQEALVRA